MVLLDHLWDDVVAGPQPERGLKHLKKVYAKPLNIKDVGAGEGSSKYQRSLSMPASPATPGTPTTPSPTAVRKENVWRSVFHPGSNLATKDYWRRLLRQAAPEFPHRFTTGFTVERRGASTSEDLWQRRRLDVNSS